MTRQEIKKILGILSVDYPRLITDQVNEREILWGDALEPYEYSVVEQAAKFVLRECKFEPKLADIFAAIKQIKKAFYPSADDQWRAFIAWLNTDWRPQFITQKFVNFLGVEFEKTIEVYDSIFNQMAANWDKLPYAIREFFGNDMQEAKTLKNKTERENQIEKNRFFKIYDDLIEKEYIKKHIAKNLQNKLVFLDVPC